MTISILIMIVGFISLVNLPVEQYPDIAPPTIMVRANYTGADADAVMNAVRAGNRYLENSIFNVKKLEERGVGRKELPVSRLNGDLRRSFAPAGQSTQMIIGATPENDYQILKLTDDF